MTQSQSIVPQGYFGEFQTPKRPLGNGPLLQWFNGLQAGRQIATGWHVEVARCSEELSNALRDYGYQQVSVLHRSTGEIVPYWQIEECNLIVLCNGFEDAWTMRETEDRDGIACGWKGNTSKVKSRVMIAEITAIGCYQVFTTSMQGFITEAYLTALAEQFRVLETFKVITSQDAPFWGFALQIGPAEQAKMVGNSGKQSPIIPTIAKVPSQITADYLASHAIAQDVISKIIENDLVTKAVQWSIETSRRINQGQDRESWETPEYDAALDSEPEPEPSPPAKREASKAQSQADSEPATKQQLAAIDKLAGNLEIHRLPQPPKTFGAAKVMIAELSKQYREMRAKQTQDDHPF